VILLRQTINRAASKCTVAITASYGLDCFRMSETQERMSGITSFDAE